MAASAVLLNVLSEQKIVTKERDRVPLLGYAFTAPYFPPQQQKLELDAKERERIAWLLTSLLLPSTTSSSTSSSTISSPPPSSITSAHLFTASKELLCVVGVAARRQTADDDSGSRSSDRQTSSRHSWPIVEEALETGREVYLADLQILPGKVEFSDYLPLNCQSVLLLPLPLGRRSKGQGQQQEQQRGIIVLGGNQAKALQTDDLRRLRSLVDLYTATATTATSSSSS